MRTRKIKRIDMIMQPIKTLRRHQQRNLSGKLENIVMMRVTRIKRTDMMMRPIKTKKKRQTKRKLLGKQMKMLMMMTMTRKKKKTDMIMQLIKTLRMTLTRRKPLCKLGITKMTGLMNQLINNQKNMISMPIQPHKRLLLKKKRKTDTMVLLTKT
jgi:hypothetical protein